MRKLFTLFLMLAIAMTCGAQTKNMTADQQEFFKLNAKDIYKNGIFASGNGSYIVFARLGRIKKNYTTGKEEVNIIYYLPPKMERTNYGTIDGYKVLNLVYHNIGKEKEYCGVWISYWEHQNGKNFTAGVNKEIRITDDAANEIIDLLTGDSKFQLIGKYFEGLIEVNHPELLKEKRQVYEGNK